MMTSFQMPDAEFLGNLLCPMRGKEEFVLLRVPRTEMFRFIVGWCPVRVEEFESRITPF
jgi:hypothetical protein